MMTLTEDQLRRVLRRLDARIRESGGCQYGWDWRTIRLTLPGIYNSLRRVITELQRRNDNGR